MSKRVTQIRFYGNGDERNWPKSLTGQMLINGKAFANYSPIIQLGIQSSAISYEDGTSYPPRFYINGSTPIQIGSTGIYELDLTGLAVISSLKFDKDFIDQISAYNKHVANVEAGQPVPVDKYVDAKARVFVDLVYEEG